MAFLGLLCGMVIGAISAVVGCVFFGLPFWMGLLTYSLFGALTTMLVVAAMFSRHSDEDDTDLPLFDDTHTRSEPRQRNAA